MMPSKLENQSADQAQQQTAHIFNDAGFCETADTLTVPMPKMKHPAVCVLLLALAPTDAKWRVGTVLSCCGVADEMPPALGDKPHADKASAVNAGLIAAVKFFRKHKVEKLAKAVETFGDTWSDTPDAAPAVATPAGETIPEGKYTRVRVAACEPNPWNRKDVPEADLARLVESIRTEGLLEAIVVRVVRAEELPGVAEVAPAEPRYQILAGEQRWLAHVALKLEWIDAKVYENVPSDRAKVWTLVENLTRTDLNPVAEAEGYETLVAEGWAQQKIAERVNRSPERVSNAMRLLRLPADTREELRAGRLSARHGEALLRFVPKGKTDAERDALIPHWRLIVDLIANLAAENHTSARDLKTLGVPFLADLKQAGLVTLIDYFSGRSVPDRLKKHPAYVQLDSGDWVALNPEHWGKECERMDEAKRAEEARAREEAAAAALKASKKKQLDIGALPADSYVQLTPAAGALADLVPAEKLASGKLDGNRTTVVTDVEFGKKLNAAWQRAVRTDRAAKAESIAEKVRKKYRTMKKVGPRELAWLAASCGDPEFRAVPVFVTDEALQVTGVKLPTGAVEGQVLETLSRMEPTELLCVLIESRLSKACEEMVEHGPDATGAQLLRWWLDSDTLWLLEESDEGKAELLGQIKDAPWYKKSLNGESAGEAAK